MKIDQLVSVGAIEFTLLALDIFTLEPFTQALELRRRARMGFNGGPLKFEPDRIDIRKEESVDVELPVADSINFTWSSEG